MRVPAALAFLGAALTAMASPATRAGVDGAAAWSPQAAAAYLDERLEWWLAWPNAARDHGTACVSCHTALPYALARPALRKSLGESARPFAEERMLLNVTTRVLRWDEVAPFYPDQTVGLPKTSESRGTEAVMNALILATRDAESGTSSVEGRRAFDNLWALQMRTGALQGAWPWLNFGLEPWEADESAYFGAALAAVAVGTAPGDYAERPDVQDRVASLRDYLQRGADTEHLFNRLMVLWASGRLPGLLSDTQRGAIVAAARAAQNPDGGWSLAALAPWERTDESGLGTASDGFATSMSVLALQEAGEAPDAPSVRQGRAWLEANQNASTGAWPAVSVNKERDLASDRGKFMSDAATAYAALALIRGG